MLGGCCEDVKCVLPSSCKWHHKNGRDTCRYRRRLSQKFTWLPQVRAWPLSIVVSTDVRTGLAFGSKAPKACLWTCWLRGLWVRFLNQIPCGKLQTNPWSKPDWNCLQFRYEITQLISPVLSCKCSLEFRSLAFLNPNLPIVEMKPKEEALKIINNRYGLGLI